MLIVINKLYNIYATDINVAQYFYLRIIMYLR